MSDLTGFEHSSRQTPRKKGLDAFSIHDLMSHRNITTTNLYVGKTSPEMLRKIVESL